MTRAVDIKVGNYRMGEGHPPLFIMGPCVIESEELTMQVARRLAEIKEKTGINLIFKASYDKANRTSIKSYRGPGLGEGLDILARVKEETGLPVITDVHETKEIAPAANVVDILQIPAFLARQTNLILEAAASGLPLNIKKGQFLSPADMTKVVEKAASRGNHNVMVTERGTFFGYQDLVVDFRSLMRLRADGYPVVFDGTHSVQQPGGLGESSGGERRFVRGLVRGATAVGLDGIFLETHPDPDKALCDGPNCLPLDWIEDVIAEVRRIREAIGQTP